MIPIEEALQKVFDHASASPEQIIHCTDSFLIK